MKKRTCVIGYTKACKRMEDLIRDGRTTQKDRAKLFTMLRTTLELARLRHKEANRGAMSRMEHDMQKLALETWDWIKISDDE